MNEDDEVDITTVEKDSAFSDSDLSQEELRFLPADPFPDVSEQQEKHTASNSKLGDSKNSDSPLSEETGAMNHDSSQIEGNFNFNARNSYTLSLISIPVFYFQFYCKFLIFEVFVL